MSAASTLDLGPPREEGDGESAERHSPPRAPRRAWRWPVGIAVLTVAVVTLGLVGLPRSSEDFDPDSAAPAGTRALVQVLARQGVEVEVVRSITAVEAGLDTTLVVTQPALVPFEELERLGAAQDLVLIEPDAVVLDELGVAATVAGTARARPLDAGCDNPDAVVAQRALAGGHLYRLTGPAEAADAGTRAWLCYRDEEGVADSPGSLAVLQTQDGNGPRTLRISVVGQRDLMRNEHLAEHGNAALAVRLLGRQPRLQWYVPDPAELPTQDRVRPTDLLPEWARWLPWQLALAAGVTMFWRGRRLGPLVHEPLPVVVRSAETQEGRARLYRQARARNRAAAALRTATLRRLAGRLQATRSSPGELADRVAGLIDADPADLRRTLTGPAPDSDRELVTLANRLIEIEQDVAGPTAGHRAGAPQDGR